MDVIPGLHRNIFSVTLALQKGFRVASEGESLILRGNSTKISFDEKMANHSGEGFILTTNFYNSANNANILPPKERNPEGKSAVQPEGVTTKNQEKTTSKQLATW